MVWAAVFWKMMERAAPRAFRTPLQISKGTRRMPSPVRGVVAHDIDRTETAFRDIVALGRVKLPHLAVGDDRDLGGSGAVTVAEGAFQTVGLVPDRPRRADIHIDRRDARFEAEREMQPGEILRASGKSGGGLDRVPDVPSQILNEPRHYGQKNLFAGLVLLGPEPGTNIVERFGYHNLHTVGFKGRSVSATKRQSWCHSASGRGPVCETHPDPRAGDDILSHEVYGTSGPRATVFSAPMGGTPWSVTLLPFMGEGSGMRVSVFRNRATVRFRPRPHPEQDGGW